MDQAQAAARSAFGVRPADPATFTTHRVGRLLHDFHRHPLMQLPALA